MEEKAKNGAKQPKKEKDHNNYNYNKKNMDWGEGRVISATSFADFFFPAFSLLGPEPEPTQIKL